MTTETEKDHARAQAERYLESIKEIVTRFAIATDEEKDKIETEIHEMPLSVLVRDGWREVGDFVHGEKAVEFEILLATGGGACRIIGDLDKYHEPDDVRLQYQDWGTPWTDLELSDEDERTVTDFCHQFCFAE